MAYKKVETKNGRTMYYKDGKLCSKKEYEANAVREPKEEPSVEQKLKASESRRCIFCNGPGTKTKWINGKVIRLCEGDYLEHTTGEIAAQMREVNV